RGVKVADKVVLGKVLRREFLFDDGKKVKDIDAVKKYYDQNKGKVFFYVEVVTIEIVENLKGPIQGQVKIIELYGGNFDSCWGSLEFLEIDKFYVLSMQDYFYPFQGENGGDRWGYELGTCYHSSLVYNNEKREVTGILRKEKVKTIPYSRLKKIII